uniref:BZIP domain-containing protein n=1 Tax=Strongyloides papillosus TaxID=174720 RepID=A0A0N5BP85_STREA
MESTKLVFVFILLINLFLAESFESKNNLVSKNIGNLQQPVILNDGEDTNSIVKRQSGSRNGRGRRNRKRRRRQNRKNRNDRILQAITQIQSQLASIATRIESFTTTTTTMAPAVGGRIRK